MAERNETIKVTHPGPARDVDLAEWLNATGFHPANTRLKQLGHEAARRLFGEVGTTLHWLLPPGRAKSIAFTDLERARIYANMALAVGGGPREEVTEGDISGLLARMSALVPTDPRIEAYEAEQRGEEPDEASGLEYTGSYGDQTPAVQPVAPFEYRREHGGPEHYTQLEIGLTGVAGPEPEVKIGVVHHDEGEIVLDGAEQWIDDPEVLESIAAYVLTMANQLRALKTRRAV